MHNEKCETADEGLEATISELRARYVLNRNEASRLFYKYQGLRWHDGSEVSVAHMGRLEELTVRVEEAIPDVPLAAQPTPEQLERVIAVLRAELEPARAIVEAMRQEFIEKRRVTTRQVRRLLAAHDAAVTTKGGDSE